MYKVVSFLLPEGPAMDMWGLESVMVELLTGARVAGSAARKLDLECLAHL